MIATYTDTLTQTSVQREWKIRSLSDAAITRQIKKDWPDVSTELKAYFGETKILVVDGDNKIADGKLTSNVFSGRVDMLVQVYKQPNHLAA